MMWKKIARNTSLGLFFLSLMFLFAGHAVQARSTSMGLAEADSAAAGAPTANIALSVAHQATTVVVDLCAKAGSLTLPGTVAIDIWGYALKPAGIPCSDSSIVPTLPGPLIEATEGDTVTITLYNELGESTALLFPGQPTIPDYAGVAAGGSKSYSLTNLVAGTYLYESGHNFAKQVPMGLYGALIVHSAISGQAYATPASAFDRELVLVLSEIDPALHVDPTGFNMLNFDPKYWLINGQAYPDTPTIEASPGERLLIRYVNAGAIHESMSLLGLYQTVVGADGFAVNFPFDLMVPNIPSGETMDVIVNIPADSLGESYPLYNRHMALTNIDSFPGGMLTFLDIVSAPAAPTVAPNARDLGAPASTDDKGD